MRLEEQSLNQNAAAVTPLGYGSVVCIYSVIVALSLLVPVPWDTWVTIAVTAAVPVYAALGWLWMRRTPLRPERAHLALFLLASAMALQNGTVLFLIGDPIHSGNQILTMMSGAFFFTVRRWFYPLIVIVLGTWLPAGLAGLSDTALSADWNQWSRMLIVSAALAIAFFESRRRSVLRVYRHKLEAEEALAQAQEATTSRLDMQRMMQESQRREALGVLAGGIAHDFNNLLAIIRGNLELLGLRRNNTAEDREMFAEIDRACDRAIELTRQMLVYAGRSKPTIGEIDLGARIRSAARLIQSSMTANVAIELDGTEHGPDIRVDSTLLDQLIVNVIQNAVEACADSGGVVRVSWGERLLGEDSLAELHFAEQSASGRFAVIDVADNGIGMDDETRRRMFEPFYSTKSDGNGLGLAVATGILQSHAAGVAVSSQQGAGTTLRLALPVSQPSVLQQQRTVPVS